MPPFRPRVPVRTRRATALGALQVARGDHPGQPVGAVVGDADGVVVVLERDHHEHRPEDLLLGDGHAVVDVGEQRGLDVEPGGQVGRHAAAADEAGALLLALVDVAEHSLLLLLRHERAHEVRRVGGVAVAHAREARGGRSTASSYLLRGISMRVGIAQPWPPWKHTDDGQRADVREVGVVEHEVDGLAAELEEHRLQGGGRRLP